MPNNTTNNIGRYIIEFFVEFWFLRQVKHFSIYVRRICVYIIVYICYVYMVPDVGPGIFLSYIKGKVTLPLSEHV